MSSDRFKPLDVVKVQTGNVTLYYTLIEVDGFKLKIVSPLTGKIDWLHADNVKLHWRGK